MFSICRSPQCGQSTKTTVDLPPFATTPKYALIYAKKTTKRKEKSETHKGETRHGPN